MDNGRIAGNLSWSHYPMIKEVKALSSVLCIATHSSPTCVCVGTHMCVPLSACSFTPVWWAPRWCFGSPPHPLPCAHLFSKSVLLSLGAHGLVSMHTCSGFRSRGSFWLPVTIQKEARRWLKVAVHPRGKQEYFPLASHLGWEALGSPPAYLGCSSGAQGPLCFCWEVGKGERWMFSPAGRM